MPARKSPGPADYALKPLLGCTNHDVNSLYKRNPCWSIGQRPKTVAGVVSPGAASYDIANLTRNGKPPTVPTTIGLRPRTSRIVFSPGLYNPVPVTVYKSPPGPRFTIGLRQSKGDKQVSPPLYGETPLGIYKHTAPRYTMAERAKPAAEDKSPGPKYNTDMIYNHTIAKQSPVYTIGERRGGGGGKEKRPGPADYDLMRYNPFASSPMYTCPKQKSAESQYVVILPQDNC